MKVELNGMPGPVSAPIVIQVYLNCLVLLIHAVSKKFLNARILGKGDVRTKVEDEIPIVAEGCGVATVVFIFVVQNGCQTRTVESVSRAQAGHSSPQHNDVWHSKDPRYIVTALKRSHRASVDPTNRTRVQLGNS